MKIFFKSYTDYNYNPKYTFGFIIINAKPIYKFYMKCIDMTKIQLQIIELSIDDIDGLK